MADSLKQYPPSDFKLQQLRAQGIVAWSRELMVFAAFVGIFLGLSILLGAFFVQIKTFFSQSFQQPVSTDYTELLFLGVSLLAKATAAFILPLFAIVALVGFFQTRFLITISPLVPNFARLFQPELAIGARFVSAIVAAVLALFWAGIFCLFVSYLYSANLFGWIYSLSQPIQVAISLKQSLPLIETLKSDALTLSNHITTFFLTAIGISFFIGAVFRFIAVLRFRNEHRMTRAEVEQEARDTEASDVFREAVRESYEAV